MTISNTKAALDAIVYYLRSNNSFIYQRLVDGSSLTLLINLLYRECRAILGTSKITSTTWAIVSIRCFEPFTQTWWMKYMGTSGQSQRPSDSFIYTKCEHAYGTYGVISRFSLEIKSYVFRWSISISVLFVSMNIQIYNPCITRPVWD
jgi:hypothetical protein